MLNLLRARSVSLAATNAIRELLRFASGHQHDLSDSGLPLASLAVAEKPDLILLDVMMPRLDGFARCAELRRRARAGV